MISFKPFRKLMRDRNISTYFLRNKCGKYNLDSKTISRLMNDQSVSTNTLDSLCQIFHCSMRLTVRRIFTKDHVGLLWHNKGLSLPGHCIAP